MQAKLFKYRHILLAGCMILITGVLQAQSMLHPGVSFEFKFPNGSNVLEMSYESNRPEISGMNEFISYNRSSIQRGSSHLAIIAYIKPEHKDNIYAVNRASVLGSVVRSYIKTRHGLNNISFTFIIRDTDASSNLVKVEYRPFPVRYYENQDIFYTLKPAYKELVSAMANYREIPFESDIKQRVMERFPEERSVNDLLKSEEELTERIVAKLVKALSEAERQEVHSQKNQSIKTEGTKVESTKVESTKTETQIPVTTHENTAAEASSVQPAASVTIPQQPARLAKESETERTLVQTNQRESSEDKQREPKRQKEREKGVYLPVAAIKTNLLGFAGVIPPSTMTDPIFNLSAELFFAKRFSLMAEGFKAPISDNTDINSQDWYKVSGAILEGRLYIGKTSLFKGLFAGVYGLYGDFDIRDVSVDEKGKTGNYTGAGLSIGYALPLYRGFTLEAGIRAGYRSDKYDTYVVNNGGFYISESLTNSEFGLTSYNIGISYRFGSYKRSGIR